MSRLLLIITGSLAVLFSAVLFTANSLAYQPQWNTVLFSFEWTTSILGSDDSRTRMVDINTRIERYLPFRYVDRARFEVSEDGTRSIIPNGRGDDPTAFNNDLFMINTEVIEAQHFLTDGPGYDAEPDAVDDLRRIVFVSDRTGTIDLYTLLLDDNDNPTVLTRITDDVRIERDPQWLTREQYHEYMATFVTRGDPIILNQEATNSF